jgi:CBS domain-containing protein
MSPRAAWRLERLGYGPVYDYAAGKVDWLAAGLPTSRADASPRRALDAADREPPTCRSDQLVSELAGSTPAATLIVVNEERIVLGRIRAGAPSTREATARVEDVMEPGPTTVRAHEPLPPLLERMARRQVDEIIVTTPEGELLGVVRRTKEDR